MTAGRLFLTSDTHLGHKFVARLRGFTSVTDHDQALIAAWNRTVTPGDTVIHLGDLALHPTDRVAEQVRALNGRIILVAGNHDTCWHRRARLRTIRQALASVAWYQQAGISEVVTSGTMLYRLPGAGPVLLSHLPDQGDHDPVDRYADRRPTTRGPIVCGHVHSAWTVSGRNINAGVDVHGLAPMDARTVAKQVRALGLAPALPQDAMVAGPWNQLGLA